MSTMLTVSKFFSQGIDDINALLLALASPPEEIQVLLISATYGNVDVQK